jgi:hypothetical protein
LFGHQRVAGAISEQTFGGTSFVRVDVPEVPARVAARPHGYPDGGSSAPMIAAHTRSFGAAAIYAINWCDEETARIAAIDIRHQPLQPYSVREAINNLPDADRHRLLTSHRERDLADADDNPF